eukprot:CAMPEP_0202977978 /NCGR_PEP_ID=MMETSP1396-20130829/84569_1 /ASSEMBLY_ACC=CAM_ASM_000872 /TAXON_ID= /ORGANISM="Pseudokeronopsis sp., Strain Brazil" /LENGTH=54 /DNA_ID=CAMNT_0049716825 /DNA_START=1330 /DNA_END=1494 /DNA_ORIENTATION=-
MAGSVVPISEVAAGSGSVVVLAAVEVEGSEEVVGGADSEVVEVELALEDESVSA